MTYIRYILCSTLLLTVMVSCGNSEKARQEKMIREGEELEKIKNRLWKIHDDVMPKTSTIYQLKKCIDNVLVTSTMTPEQSAALENAKIRLDNADKAMFDWMHDIHDLEKKTDVPFEELKKQYEAQIPLVEAVRDSMLNSIGNAEKLLEGRCDQNAGKTKPEHTATHHNEE